METFLVLYRRSSEDPDKMVGNVEKIGIDDTCIFHNMDEMCRILSPNFKKTTDKKAVKGLMPRYP